MMQRAGIILWAMLLLAVCATAAGGAQNDNTLSKIARANELYHEKNYQSAAESYEALIAAGLENGYLYYNLGNSYMRLGQTGRGILNYLHAKTLLPRDENLDANLRYAVQQTVDQIEPPVRLGSPARLGSPLGGFVSGVLFWMESLNRVEHLQFLVAFNVIFWVVLIGWLFYRNPAWDITRKTAMGFLLLAMVSAGAKYYFAGEQSIGVVLANEVDIKSDKGAQNVTLFQLHAGAIVSVGAEEGGWVRVSLGTDKTGWAPKETVGF
ncbi:MAG: hypothetical protein IID18_05675 [Nitrospinae bacterium]|nr:hypothetical protein [Nitrospinota bacterium]